MKPQLSAGIEMDLTDIPDNSNQPKAAEEAYNPILCQPVDDGRQAAENYFSSQVED
jgi:hypothetical protein